MPRPPLKPLFYLRLAIVGLATYNGLQGDWTWLVIAGGFLTLATLDAARYWRTIFPRTAEWHDKRVAQRR